MMTVRLAKEVEVRVRRNPATIANVTKVLADKGLDLLAVQACVEGGEAILRFVTDDNLRAVDALRERELSPVEREVVAVEVPHKPGMVRRIAEVLSAERIELDHLYATAGDVERTSLVVLATTNNDHALVSLRNAR